jgi:hypothetical protein
MLGTNFTKPLRDNKTRGTSGLSLIVSAGIKKISREAMIGLSKKTRQAGQQNLNCTKFQPPNDCIEEENSPISCPSIKSD